MSQIRPLRCTARIARVRSVMHASMVSALTLIVPGAVSANTGMYPALIRPCTVPKSLTELTMISSPGSKSKAAASTARAGVHPGVAIQWATPLASAKARSNRPTMSQVSPESTTSARYSMARGPISRGKGCGRGPSNSCWVAAP